MPLQRKCTCAGCGAASLQDRFLHHYWQYTKFIRNGNYFEPCLDLECYLLCQNDMDAEDLLCKACRDTGKAISYTDTERITELLRQDMQS